MRFTIFPLHLSKVWGLPRNSEARSYEVLHLSRKIILANLKISCSKMQPLSGNFCPDLLTHLPHVSLVLHLPRKMRENVSLQILFKCPMPAIVFGNARKPLRLLTFDKVHNPFRRPRETTSERPKVLRTRQFFALLTWKCASRHNMPQRRTLFERLNFQRCSEADVLWTF